MGSLPAGTYQLCVVPNDSYTLGEPHEGLTISCAQLTASGGSVPATRIWTSAQAGEYDLLALTASERGAAALIIAGDDLGPLPGLRVQASAATPTETAAASPTATPTTPPSEAAVPAPRTPWLMLGLLAVAAFGVLPRRRRA
jgi:hypothetical protein